MGLLKKILNWKRKREEEPIYEIEDWNEIVYDRDDEAIKDTNQRQEYVRGCMDQIAEAIAMVIREQENGIAGARAIVQSLTDKYPLI